MPIYDKPIWALMQEAASELRTPFSRQDVVQWFARKYPKIKKSSVTAHVSSCCVNDKNRKHHKVVKDILYRRGDGLYENYDPEKHGALHSDAMPADEESPSQQMVVEEPQDIEAAGEFLLESHLAEFIEANWHNIDFGAPLQIYKDDGSRIGREWDTGAVGRIDFLCRDTRNGDFVIIELKKGRPADKVLGQVQRYMGWVAEHLAQGRGVRGIIVTPSQKDEQLRYALKVTRNIEWRCYRMSFQLGSPSDET